MYRADDYRALMARLNAPENSDRKKALSLAPSGFDITFHINRIEQYVNELDTANDVTKKLMELDYGVSLNKIMEMMDEQGWK